MAMITNAAEIKQLLLDHVRSGHLQQTRLSEDGSALLLANDDNNDPTRSVSIDATALLTIEWGEKSCQYSVASLFLQIQDPDQPLMKYRTACKTYHVTDPVKALDKPIVVAYFLGEAVTAALAGGDAEQPSTAIADHGTTFAADDQLDVHAQDDDEEEEEEEVLAKDSSQNDTGGVTDAQPGETTKKATFVSDGSDVVKKDRKKHHSSSKHHKDRHRSKKESGKRKEKPHEEKTAKKKKQQITNEELFSNLNVVVDKRTKHLLQTQEEITLALSTDGFQVTPELIEQYREQTERILSHEIPVGNSASILRAVNPQKNLSRVLELYLETVTKPSTSSSKPGSSNTSSRNFKPVAPPVRPKLHLVGKKPVILVPKGMTAPITLINAHEFFCNGRFVERNVMIKQGRHRNPPTTFTRTVKSLSDHTGSSGNMLEYEIMDNPKKLGSDLSQWERIVAVIVLGQAWQFKDWPAPYCDPVHLFARTYGFFICMEGDKLPHEISQWAVKQARLNRDKRGLDSVTFASFWNGLDEYMTVHKRELLPQHDMV